MPGPVVAADVATLTAFVADLANMLGQSHPAAVNICDPGDVAALRALVPASTATAGIPGYFTPAGAVPANLAALTGVTASPASNWTTGQYVALRDGTTANWTGAAWAAGIHA